VSLGFVHLDDYVFLSLRSNLPSRINGCPIEYSYYSIEAAFRGEQVTFRERFFHLNFWDVSGNEFLPRMLAAQGNNRGGANLWSFVDVVHHLQPMRLLR